MTLDQAFSPDPTDCPWVSEDGEAWVGRLGYSTKFYMGRLGQDFASLLTAVNATCFTYGTKKGGQPRNTNSQRLGNAPTERARKPKQ